MAKRHGDTGPASERWLGRCVELLGVLLISAMAVATGASGALPRRGEEALYLGMWVLAGGLAVALLMFRPSPPREGGAANTWLQEWVAVFRAEVRARRRRRQQERARRRDGAGAGAWEELRDRDRLW